jgi:hypothetical protein
MRLLFNYCLFLTFWQSGWSSNSEARGGPNFLKFLHNDLARIHTHIHSILAIKKNSNHRRFFWSGVKKK